MKLTLKAEVWVEEELVPPPDDQILNFFKDKGFIVYSRNGYYWGIYPNSDLTSLYFTLVWDARENQLETNIKFDINHISLLITELIKDIDTLVAKVNGGDLSSLDELADLVRAVDDLKRRGKG